MAHPFSMMKIPLPIVSIVHGKKGKHGVELRVIWDYVALTLISTL
jgi:hypothetical protein